MDGQTGSIKTKNYLKQDVLSAYGPIKILDKDWGMISEISVPEAFRASYSIQKMMLTVFAMSFLVIFILAYFISNSLANKISSVATKLRLSTTDVEVSSDKILGSSVQLSEAVTEQAASLQETVSSIDEISSMIQKNADGANFSKQASDQSNKVALFGKKTVNDMLGSISAIAESNDLIADEMKQSNQDIEKVVKLISDIGEKTKVINDIAFQTKLLSFNASVEAARAGEHGKGFAVVAQEVGNLADVSSKAALEINLMLDNSLREVNEIFKSTKIKVEELISSSKSKVVAGNQTATECAKSLDEIINNVSSVSEMVREIASASVEQSTGVQEVTKAMQQLDTTNHQNAVVAQESSNTAQKLKIYADNLNQTVNELMAIVEGIKSE